MSSQPHTSVPGVEDDAARRLSELLQARLVGTLDLQLALKHIHWNVVGPSFLSVHEMLDTQVEAVRAMSDEIAERIATLGGQPNGNSGAIVEQRTWDDYPHGRDTFLVHLHELDAVYSGVIEDHRSAISESGDLDPVTEDLLIGQTAKLEMAQWFVRSFVERSGESDGATSPSSATRAAEDRDSHRSKDAGDEPTPDEARTADENAKKVDLDAVEDDYREMTAVGANVKGEGQIS